MEFSIQGRPRLPTDSPPTPSRRRPTDDADRPRLASTDDRSNGSPEPTPTARLLI